MVEQAKKPRGKKPIDSTAKFEQALKADKKAKRVLRLYVAGNTQKSAQAIAKIHEICETHLKGRYELEVIDIYQQPQLARSQQIIAAPTLIKVLPLPLRRIIGDLTRTDRILVGLDLTTIDEGAEGAAEEPPQKPKKKDGNPPAKPKDDPRL